MNQPCPVNTKKGCTDTELLYCTVQGIIQNNVFLVKQFLKHLHNQVSVRKRVISVDKQLITLIITSQY